MRLMRSSTWSALIASSARSPSAGSSHTSRQLSVATIVDGLRPLVVRLSTYRGATSARVKRSLAGRAAGVSAISWRSFVPACVRVSPSREPATRTRPRHRFTRRPFARHCAYQDSRPAESRRIATATALEPLRLGARARRRRAYAPDATGPAKWRFCWSSAATASRKSWVHPSESGGGVPVVDRLAGHTCCPSNSPRRPRGKRSGRSCLPRVPQLNGRLLLASVWRMSGRCSRG
jgi:hypothetical protein